MATCGGGGEASWAREGQRRRGSARAIGHLLVVGLQAGGSQSATANTETRRPSPTARTDPRPCAAPLPGAIVNADMRGPAGERERGPTEWAALAAVVSAAALSGLQFGYDTGVISGAILKIADELRLSDTDQELVVAATTLGALISSLLGASIANALGRRPALAIASAIFVVGCAVLGLAPSLWVLLLGRFVVGLAIGASSAVTPVYLAESARSRDRGWLIAVNTMCITGGQVVAALVDALVQDLPGSWRWMLGLGAVPGAFQLFALFFVPESPRFLAMCGRLTEAGSALSYLRGEQSLRAEPAPISAGSGSADDKDPPGADCIEGAPEEAPSETAAILPAREASTAADELLPDARLDSDIESDADADAGRAGASAPAARRRARGRLSSAARSPAVVAELAAIRASVRGGAGALSVRQLLCTSDPALRWAMVLSASAQLAQQLGGEVSAVAPAVRLLSARPSADTAARCDGRLHCAATLRPTLPPSSRPCRQPPPAPPLAHARARARPSQA